MIVLGLDPAIRTTGYGVVEYDGLMSKESMFAMADKKMYEAKKGGKNDIVV